MNTFSDTIPAPTQQSAERAEEIGTTPELHALLGAYSNALDNLNSAPAILWVTLRNRRLLGRLAFPAARRIVTSFFVRYLYRCIDALKSGAIRRGVVSDTVDERNGDLEMLEHFEESLPPRLRLALAVPVVLLVVLSFAYLLAWMCDAGYRNLFGDLMASAMSMNRASAIAALQSAYRLAQLQHPLEAYFFAGAAMIVAWSAVAAIVPLLPAFYVVRRERARLADVETRGFAAVGARTVHGVELDLIVRMLLIPAVALLGVAAVTQAVTEFLATGSLNVASVAIGALSAALTVLAGMELHSCYHERRQGTARCRSFATKVSLALVAVLSTGLFVSLPFWERNTNRESILWPRTIAQSSEHLDEARGWLTNQLSFLITKIEQNTECTEPHGLLIDYPQYLRFDLEVWSDVDQFANPATARALALPHWSVRDSKGNPTGSLFMHAKCGRGTEAISEPIVPGAHTNTSVVVSAPRDASILELDIPSYRGVWQWPIPPAAPRGNSA
jgi:hypothetical protein